MWGVETGDIDKDKDKDKDEDEELLSLVFWSSQLHQTWAGWIISVVIEKCA